MALPDDPAHQILMQTHFTLKQLQDPRIAEADGIIQTCQHFGFCTATCPTYTLLGDENDAPRGRIDLTRAMLEQGGAPDAKTVGHIDRCLSCLACMTTCAVRVDYMHLVDRARVHIEKHFRRPLPDRLLRALLARVLPYPGRLRAALLGARLARPFGRLLRGRLSNLLAMGTAKSASAEHDIVAGIHLSQGPRRHRVALLAGCAQRVLAPQVNAATMRLLTRHGCDVVVARDAACCGALTLHMGREEEAREAARRNVDAWMRQIEASGLDAIIVNASGCGTTVKDYGHLLRHDPTYAARAARVAALALDISEFMMRIDPAPPAAPRRIAVAYHDACSLRNAQRVTTQPRHLLASAGFVVRDVPEAQFCCGSAGTYNLLQPEIAGQLGQRKAAHVESTQASVLAVGNVGCMVQIARYAGLPVVHTVELLDWATGGPLPGALEGRALPELPPEQPAAAAFW
jgi:glycolate oxidase iron-sulfur subunit